MNEEIQHAATARGITRLCHFTPSRNLAHIVCDEVGVLATKRLKEKERKVFNPTDLERLDHHEGHICCSVEYPNAWYFEKARAKEPLFPDWVVLFIRPDYLWHDSTIFSPRNAAAGYGRALKGGIDGFKSIYADSVVGAYGKKFVRASSRLPCVPTDDQAEVLVADCILMRDVLAVAVSDSIQAKNEIARLRLLGHLNKFRFVIAPDLFNKARLSELLHNGIRPTEEEWI